MSPLLSALYCPDARVYTGIVIHGTVNRTYRVVYVLSGVPAGRSSAGT